METYFSKANVRNPILVKPLVLSPKITIFSSLIWLFTFMSPPKASRGALCEHALCMAKRRAQGGGRGRPCMKLCSATARRADLQTKAGRPQGWPRGPRPTPKGPYPYDIFLPRESRPRLDSHVWDCTTHHIKCTVPPATPLEDLLQFAQVKKA